VYGCDQTAGGKCYLGVSNNTAATYPLQGATPYLYGLITGQNAGPTLSAGATDVITVVYVDPTFYLNCYNATVTAKGVVTFAPPPAPTAWPTPGCLPSSVAAPQTVNNSVAGLTTGDLVLMTLNGTRVVGEVTGAITTATATSANAAYTTVGATMYNVPFSNNDVLKMNQTPTAGTGLNSVPLNATGATPWRILAITYYVDSTVTPPRLMRQVSGHTPMPVAENIVYMKFSYDLFNDATNTPAIGCVNPGAAGDVCVAGASTGLLPNQITKINIVHMAIDSQMRGTQGYQGLDLHTSVSARNLTFANNYAQ
jgi:hypothetical protein